MSQVTIAELAAAIRNVPDFPKPGIQFKDITPVLADARLFEGAMSLLVEAHRSANVQKGGPQGGVLTPVLWNLVIDELLTDTHLDPVLKTGYADDVTAIASGPAPDTLRDLLQGFISRAVAWAERCGLRLSESKTVAIMFTHKLLWKIKPLW